MPTTNTDSAVFVRRWLQQLLCLAGAFSLCVAVVSCDQPRPIEYTGKARHLVMISLDTARADHFGFYGNSTVRTPHLDALAAESVVLDDFHTVVPTTLASHTTLFTGKYPHHHGVPRNGFLVNGDNVMLAEMLEPYGFISAAFAASFALEQRFGLYQGFHHFSAKFERWSESQEVMQNERRAEAVTDDIISYLEERGVPKHLFLFAHYFDAHAPYEPPEPYDTLYDPKGREGLKPGMDGWRAVAKACNALGAARTSGADRQAKQYAGEISYMDHHVGRLLAALDARGVLDEALVVVTSDHGENHWEHLGCFDHGWSTYDTETRAVGILRLPGGVHAGQRIGQPLSSIDIAPTVARYLGLSMSEQPDGVAFDLDRLAELPDVTRLRFAQATKPPDEGLETDPRWRNMLKPRSVRQGRYKLIQVPYEKREQLFDLEVDPGETSNLLAAPTAAISTTAARLRRELVRWAGSADPLPSAYIVDADREACERLKALGYVVDCDTGDPP